MNHQTARPAFGETAAVGTLYDAKTDKFLASSILKSELAPGVTVREKLGRKDVQLSYYTSYADKFKRLAIGPELGASILCGSVTPGGAGCFLHEPTIHGTAIQAAI